MAVSPFRHFSIGCMNLYRKAFKTTTKFCSVTSSSLMTWSRVSRLAEMVAWENESEFTLVIVQTFFPWIDFSRLSTLCTFHHSKSNFDRNGRRKTHKIISEKKIPDPASAARMCQARKGLDTLPPPLWFRLHHYGRRHLTMSMGWMCEERTEEDGIT